MQLWRYVAFVSVAVVVAAVSVRWGFWFMRSVPMCSWQLNSFRVDHPFAPPYDAVVVLGYAIDYRRLEPTPQLQQRLMSAAKMFCDARGRPAIPTPATHLILSGGLARQQNVTEAVVMARYLMRQFPLCFSAPRDVDVTAVTTPTPQPVSGADGDGDGERVQLLLERQSVSTRTNAQRTFELLVDERLTAVTAFPSDRSRPLRVRVITNPFHQYRTHRVFECVAAEEREEHMRGGFAGFEVSMHACDTASLALDATAPTSTPPPTALTALPPPAAASVLQLVNPQKDWWRECLAIAYYAVRRWI